MGKETLQVDREKDGCQQGSQRNDPGEVVNKTGAGDGGGGISKRVASQGQTDDHGDGTCDGGGKQVLNHIPAKFLHEETSSDRDQTGHHNTEGDNLDVSIGEDGNAAQFFSANQTDNGTNIREAGAIIQGDFAFGDQDETKCGETAGKNGGGNMEFGNEGDGNRGREHNDNLLDCVE